MSDNAGFLINFLDEEVYSISPKDKNTEQNSGQAQVYIISNEVYKNNPSSELAILLSKILTAVNLDFSKVVLTEQFEETIEGRVIVFGDLSLKEKYKIEQTGSATILRADFLRTIAVSPDLKKLLWHALKKLF